MNITLTEPKIETCKEQFYVSILAKMPMRQMGKVLLPLWDEVFAFIAENDLKQAGAPFWRYRIINMEGEMHIEAGVPISKATRSAGRIIADSFPAGQYVRATYTGKVKGKGLYFATGALLEWAQQHGVDWDAWDVPEGHAWAARSEFYLTDPETEPDPAKWQTELVFKVKD